MGNLVIQAQSQFQPAIENAQNKVKALQQQLIDNQTAITSLNSQIASKSSYIEQHLALAATYQQNFNTRKDCGGFKQACNNWLDKRDAENRLVAAARGELSSLQSQLNTLNSQRTTLSNNLKQAELAVQQANSSYNEAISRAQAEENAALVVQTQATQASNPVYQQSQIQKELALATLQSEEKIKQAQIQAQLQATATNEAAKTVEKEESKKNTLYIIIGAALIAVLVIVFALRR